jgi:protein-tyrosine phosphatase
MNVLFLCTDNYTRSVIAEFCMKDYLTKTNQGDISVSSAGIRANSDISMYSNIHFEILNEMGVNTSEFKRMMFDQECFHRFDVIIGMSQLHVQYVTDNYGKEIILYNDLLDGSQTSVQVGSPDSDDFKEQMRNLINYIKKSTPELVEKIKKISCG